MSKERQSKKTKIIVGALVVGAVGICTAFMLYNTKFAPTQAEPEMEIQEESNVVIDETLEQEVEDATGMEIVEETVEVELTEDEVSEEVSTEPDGVSDSLVEVEEDVADAETTETEVAGSTESTEGEVAQNKETVKPQESSEPQPLYPADSAPMPSKEDIISKLEANGMAITDNIEQRTELYDTDVDKTTNMNWQ